MSKYEFRVVRHTNGGGTWFPIIEARDRKNGRWYVHRVGKLFGHWTQAMQEGRVMLRALGVEDGDKR